MPGTVERFVRAATARDVETAGRVAVQVDGHAVVLFADGGRVYAVDNRCPHMGFPLQRGSLKDGILTCHWHHARFDLATGGTFDPWADDVRVFPTQIRDGEVWVDLAPPEHLRAHSRQRLRDGLEREIPLVIAKAVLTLLAADEAPEDPLRIGLEFGSKYRRDGWGQGLTILTCMHNLLPHLEPDDRPRALYHGLAAVARDCAGAPPRFELRPLPQSVSDFDALKRWFRQFIEVRDAEGAERCIVTAVRAGANTRQMADLLFSAVTDHRYLTTGHLLDFTNKAFEALDAAGWERAEMVLSSLAPGYAEADRMEEANEWRHPIDLVDILEHAFEQLPEILRHGRTRRGQWTDRAALVPVLLGEDPQAIADGLVTALHDGCGEVDLAGVVAYAAAIRIAQFHTSNEFTDWDTALHTFTFVNAVQQGLRRSPSPELVRGIFDAAMSVYLDRFLNVPPARLPRAEGTAEHPEDLLAELPALLNRQQQVNETGTLVAAYLHGGGDPARLRAALGKALLREDRNFHTIQVVETAYRQFAESDTPAEGINVLVAAARYLAAHAPTVRAQGQTYQFAVRLNRGERLYEDSDRVVATVLFTDIVGSTARASEVGDRRWKDLLTSYAGLMQDEINRHRGRLVETAGDGALVTFDSAGRAIRCAQAIITASRRIGIPVRAGIHTGEVEIADGGVTGIAVHIGARVAAQAGAGEVLVTGTVKDLVTGLGVAFDDRGTEVLKGVPGEWRLFAVTW
jgi:class 3 adenylate cyclase/nitrite reductase/ring-hydroxylating ferredoxin subunit